jgi:IS element ISTsi1 orfA, putative resolvase
MGWVRIKKAAEILKLSTETVRQWSNTGRIQCSRSAAGQRVYDEDYLRELAGETTGEDTKPIRVFYARASSGQDVSIGTQQKLLEKFYKQSHKTFTDKASGLSENRKGLKALLAWVKNHPGTIVCVTTKDRLTRFGFTYLESLIAAYGGSVEVLEDETVKEPQEALMSDFMALLASFSGKFYRLRGWEQQRRLLNDVSIRVDKKVAERV